MTIDGFRTIGLALVTLLGAAHLSTAEATPLNADACDDYAAAYAAGYCARSESNWSMVSYNCEGGTATNLTVTCEDEEQEPQETIK